MPDLRTKLRARLFRRASAQAPHSAFAAKDNQQQQQNPSSAGSAPSRTESFIESPLASADQLAKPEDLNVKNEDQEPLRRAESSLMSGEQTLQNSVISYPSQAEAPTETPDLVLQEPTPEESLWKKDPVEVVAPLPGESKPASAGASAAIERKQLLSDINKPSKEAFRKQSIIANVDLEIIKSLLQEDPQHPPIPEHPTSSTLMPATTSPINTGMLHRKIWVKKTGSAATLVLIREDDLVDDVKEAILKKYSNNLGKHYDAPDITLRILSREKPGERILNPDESMCRTLDSYYPNGQTVDEALLIDVPPKRTPRPSPRIYHQQMSYYYPPEESTRPLENGTDYFPPMPPVQASPAALTNMSHDSRHSHAAHERAMSVLSTGQVPPLPSPGGTRRAHVPHKVRPSFNRQHTSSPTAPTFSVGNRPNRPRLDSRASDEHKHAPTAPPLPTPPAQESTASVTGTKTLSNPPTPRVASPRPGQKRKTKPRPSPSAETQKPTLANHLSVYIDTSVPPINVLIVEDNHINMKLLEQFIRRLKVRWQTAVNGREAVNKWRQGGFHLVLMDIQLPIMSGIEATKEIRRLERVNRIGVFSHGGSSGSSTAPNSSVAVDENGELVDEEEEEEESEHDGLRPVRKEDLLEDKARLFKSPVIIVALTASNLQSDRHEALAAGCNDFLTKVRLISLPLTSPFCVRLLTCIQPVNFVWFERKVKEWGCMQALIDFDGWRKWKGVAVENNLKGGASPIPPKAMAKEMPSKRASLQGSSPTMKKDMEPLRKEDSPDTVVEAGN